MQVLIKIHCSGVNPVDTYLRSGTYAKLPDLPYIPGKDAAGIVHSTGSLVSKLKVCMDSEKQWFSIWRQNFLRKKLQPAHL